MEPSFIEAVKALGIAGGPVFGLLWWLERTERIECQKLTKDMLIQSLTVTGQATHSVTSVTSALSDLKDGMNDGTKALAQLIRSIAKK